MRRMATGGRVSTTTRLAARFVAESMRRGLTLADLLGELWLEQMDLLTFGPSSGSHCVAEQPLGEGGQA